MKSEIFMVMKIDVMIFKVMIPCILVRVTSISEEHITSIPCSGFLVGGGPTFWNRTLKMEVVSSPEMISSVKQ
jgi:hypothetical protein